MKLFSEKLTKYKFFFLSVFSIIEITCFILIYISYKPLYIKVFEQTKDIAIEKTLSITHSLNEIIKITFNRHILDLKFIGKHMSFLSNNNINNKSQYYNNLVNNDDKHLFNSSLEELMNNFSEYFDQNKSIYLEKYIKDYIDNDINRIKILPDLMNSSLHSELNSISYYKLNGNVKFIENNKEKRTAAKYLISILKTNYIKNIIVKGRNMEINHYFLLNKEEAYIYPPDIYENLEVLKIAAIVGCPGKNVGCIYDKLQESVSLQPAKGYIFPIIPFSNIEYENIVNIICLNVPFEKKLILHYSENNPFICVEINMTKAISGNLFQSKEAFHFIYFAIYDDIIIPMISDDNEMYDEIKKFFNNSKFKDYNINSEFTHFQLFHFFYLDVLKETEALKQSDISLNEIFNEYKGIYSKIMENTKIFNYSEKEYFEINIQKTTCSSDIYYNSKTCTKDNFMILVYPLSIDFYVMNENYIEDKILLSNQNIFYLMSIISNNYDYMKWKINKIIVIKIVKLFIFYFISSSCLIFLFFIFVQLFYEFKYDTINQILQIIKGGSFFEIQDKNEIIQKKEQVLLEPNNKEMLEIKNLFDYLVKTMLFKINFEQNENNFNDKKKKSEDNEKNNKNKINSNSNNSISNRTNKSNKNNFDTLNEFIDLINNIDNNEIRIMFSFIMSYLHFKKGLYKLAENEFKNLIIEMNVYQNKISNKNENNDSTLKDTISRSSRISYLNEYSLTNELSETMLPIIKVKLLSQKIYYLYALSIFNQEKKKENNDKKYNKENAKKRYEEAIKYFVECKNISILLGTDTIRQIFSLIMISRCYIELKNYKESMINLNEALLLFSDLQKAFKDKPYFNPKIMMFTENYIFQSIMLSIAQTTFSVNKYPQSCWILMKMIETSPFIFNTIHFQASFLLCNCLSQIEGTNNLPIRQVDKYKKRINKIFARINVRLYNKEKKMISDSRSNTNIPSLTNTQVNTLSVSIDNMGNASNLRKLTRNKDLYTSKLSISVSSLSHITKNKYKNINLCISEKVIQEINGDELKDVIIKFFKKCFSNGVEEDKYNFIQFSCNGKKTISIKTDSLEIFLQKIETNKMAFKINEAFTQNGNNQIQFMELSNLFLSIIKSHKHINYEDRGDNIIIIFINTSDIRFNGQKECVDTINELNTNNYSVIFFTYDIEIDEEKIEGIYSFVYGLNDGHFFQIRNYQQIKQVLMNFCLKDSQEKFNNYNYEITDFML